MYNAYERTNYLITQDSFLQLAFGYMIDILNGLQPMRFLQFRYPLIHNSRVGTTISCVMVQTTVITVYIYWGLFFFFPIKII